MVLTSSGATSSVTYRVSLRAGSLTPVEAISGRCLLAPALASSAQSAFSNSCSNTSYAKRALAKAALLFIEMASAVPTATKRLSISVSTRETKNEATE